MFLVEFSDLREVIWKLKLIFLRVLLFELESVDDLANFLAVSFVKITSFEILHDFFPKMSIHKST